MQQHHHHNHDPLKDFYVVTIISNPIRYQSRYKLYRQFAEMCRHAGVTLITVEQAFGDRPFMITERDNINHLQVRSVDELWHKENMLNLGMNYMMQVYPNAKYVAWVDADVFPMMPPRQWFEETYHALQHYEIVQMFEWSMDLDPSYNALHAKRHSFIAEYIENGYHKPVKAGIWETAEDGYYNSKNGHTGFAWAANVDAITKLGGLLDVCIVGAGDWHMAHALVNCIEMSIPKDATPGYIEHLMNWQLMAERHIKQDIGFVHGTIYHYWHGKKVDRKYWDRWKILWENAYDPRIDIKKDVQGLWVLESWDERQRKMRDQMRSYFRQRNEDSIDA